ncbi:exodeoxyribonuclease VII large subunit [Agathobacter ruminis]|uniref:Exodeoxyribonuclease 7 large subunit n=1 Tax=Agathobacter ruminis TaxID=1712665 RepID=A0A2G3E3B1_9FIRM|nr:exodeoxyribonuclease VII large subunit [Agathobacter ruminis]MDC7302674.1 exodeoxyribonuclease VII large subunit [Agathobacter ruminis]PHU37766.1 exodeoxyribonuclease VII large subunit [Agathobacter ruminis]
MNKSIYSVAQINKYIKNMFAQDFVLNHVSIKGEVSNCKYHSSGHIYFTLKDEGGVLKCVMFRQDRGGLSFSMKEGDKVIVSGRMDVYERSGEYQLYAKEIELDGAGNLFLKFEALKRELAEMGMFAPEYKQPIPKYASTIGIVTAQTGAAIQDIRNVASRRNPSVQLILYPAQVQGEGAAETIVQGIRALETYGVDVIIVGRGGGSIEDLWAFNEEIVARAIFDCRTPIVSAVGHEVDWTIADYVADMRAPTPSAAAELCVFDRNNFMQDLAKSRMHMNTVMNNKIRHVRLRLENDAKHIELLSPQHKLRELQQRLDNISDKITYVMKHRLDACRNRLQLIIRSLESNSPLRKMESGFAYVQIGQKRLISVDEIHQKDEISITLRDGEVLAEVKEVKKYHESY